MESERIKDGIVRVGSNGCYIGEAMERDEFGLRVGGFVMPKTCATVPESVRAGTALLSGRERETTTERALE